VFVQEVALWCTKGVMNICLYRKWRSGVPKVWWTCVCTGGGALVYERKRKASDWWRWFIGRRLAWRITL